MKVLTISNINYDYYFQRNQQLHEQLGIYQETYWQDPTLTMRLAMKNPTTWKLCKRGIQKRIQQKIDATKPDVIITYTPLATNILNKGIPIIYECVDDTISFQGIGQHVKKLENEMLSEADITIVPAHTLKEKLKHKTKKIKVIPNGVPSYFLEQDIQKGNNVVYVGAVAKWVDTDLIKNTASLMPDTKFDIYGGGKLPNSTNNVTYHGKIPYEKVKKVIANAGVCILPFKQNDLTDCACPIKMFEYFSMDKPVVSTPIKEVMYYNIANIAENNPSHFSVEIEESFKEKPNGKYRKFASGFTWTLLAEEFNKEIEKL